MPKDGTACHDRSLQPGWTTPPGRLGAAASSWPCQGDFYRSEDGSIVSLQDRSDNKGFVSRKPLLPASATKLNIPTGSASAADPPTARPLSERAGAPPHGLCHDERTVVSATSISTVGSSAHLTDESCCLLNRDNDGATAAKPFAHHSRWRAPCSFLQFPPEIRNMIYIWSLQLPDSRTLYSSYYAPDPSASSLSSSGAEGTTVPFKPRLRTPTVLLLCRPITAECMPILRAGWLVIDRPPPWQPGTPRPMALTAFISATTLQHLRRIDVRPTVAEGRFGSSWAWCGVLDELVDVLLERNCFAELRVLVKMHNVGLPNVWQWEWPGHKRLLQKIKELQAANPRFWQPGVINVEVWRVGQYEAKKLKGDVQRNILVDDTGKEVTRYYPDAEFWPGSVLEFL